VRSSFLHSSHRRVIVYAHTSAASFVRKISDANRAHIAFDHLFFNNDNVSIHSFT
jgi:hypothetical protein